MGQARKVVGYRPTPFFFCCVADRISGEACTSNVTGGSKTARHIGTTASLKKFPVPMAVAWSAIFLFGRDQRFTERGLDQVDRSVRCDKSATDQAGTLCQRATGADSRCGFCGA